MPLSHSLHHTRMSTWLSNPWLCWGLGPYIASNVGFLLTAGILEVVASCMQGSLITYASSSHTPRQQLLVETHKRLPFRKQLQGSLKFILGFPTIASTFGLAVAMQLVGITATSWRPDTALQVLLQLLMLAVLADFGLYWGHRVQHESAFLWKFHSKHHAIDTPTPFSTLFIHPVDALLQGSLPLAFAALLVRPAPAVLYLFFAARLGENAVNHSGLDSQLVDVLTLKVLPLRASIAHHDAHHKYSNHHLNAKNYGETFWVWDALFMTLSSLSGRASARQPVKSQ